ncbi:MAG: 7-carboxy-7-deazaguanine synthase QueE [Bacteroidales bacterium]|jgi:7-carboxy-7-deazaguanine synthase|nr:7-carboxy-7-deazaguanine synthase QueE [Bacteroidales bacterium]
MMALNKRYDPEKLPVLEEFYSVQGEGLNSGKASYFVRIGGCDLGCRWCDSKETWDWVPDEWISAEAIVQRVLKSGAKSVVVTGGEPLIYDFSEFTELCHQHGIKRYLETSGAHELSGDWDWICLSPKPQKQPLPVYYELANELKVIIFKPSDFEWAEETAKKVNPKCELLLQPEWSKFPETGQWAVDYVKANQQWRISVQTHKFLQIP